MIELQRKSFASAIALASMPLERRNTIPILSAVRCRANGALEFEGTDLDITVIARLAAPEPHWEGQFIMPSPAAAMRAVNTAGGDTVQLRPDGDTLTIDSGELSMKGSLALKADDFPVSYPVAARSWGATLSRENVLALARVAKAMSKEETRYYLNGILLQAAGGWDYKAVATDGHRMSIMAFALPDAAGDLPDNIIIPRKAIGMLLAMAAKSKGPFTIAVGSPGGNEPPALHESTPRPGHSTRVQFDFEQAAGLGASLCIKLIDGTYPDYKRVVPTPQLEDQRFQIKAADLRRGVVATSHGSQEKRAIKVVLHDNRETATLSRASDGAFNSSITVPCEHNSPGFEVGFNAQYLLDTIDAAGGTELLFTARDSTSPFRVTNPADTHWTGVLMPMRV